MGRESEIECSVRSWLDNVIVPALIRQYIETKKVRAGFPLPSDNNPLVTNANEPKEVQP